MFSTSSVITIPRLSRSSYSTAGKVNLVAETRQSIRQPSAVSGPHRSAGTHDCNQTALTGLRIQGIYLRNSFWLPGNVVRCYWEQWPGNSLIMQLAPGTTIYCTLFCCKRSMYTRLKFFKYGNV